MSSYQVSLVVENLALTDQNLARLFEVLPDSVPASIGGVVTVTSPIDAAHAEGAAFALVEAVVGSFPDAVPVRLDQDLVSISDIAERTERSRQSIRLLVEGKRGPGGFPGPVGIVGDGIRVWPWAVVLDWFRDDLGEDLDERGVVPVVAAVVDACLAARRRHLAHRTKVAWSTPRQVASKVKHVRDLPRDPALAS